MAKSSWTKTGSLYAWITTLLIAWIAMCPCDALGGDLYVVAIGIENYDRVAQFEPVTLAETDAKEFQNYVQNRWKINAHVTLLNGPSATKDRIENTVYVNLSKAGSGDAVFLFISARGGTDPITNAGYIFAHNSLRENPQGTAIPLKYFDTVFHNRLEPVGPVYLFADLCRREGTPIKNWIQDGLEKLAKDNVSIQGFLATKPNEPSKDGVFTRALTGAIQQPRPDLQSEYDAFFEVVRTLSKGQNPDKLPMRASRRTTQYRPAFEFRRYPGELALLGSPIPLLFAMQAGASTARLRDEFQAALAVGKLTTPGGAFDLLKSLQAVEAPSAAAEDMATLLGALEDKAQQVIVDYGSGEQFPNDPLRLDAVRFTQAADYFDHAATLERQARKDEMVARALFCSGRAKLFDGPGQDIGGAADDLRKAAQRHPEFPEPYNAMGLVHLALAKATGPALALQRASELDQAAKQFEMATKIARAWAYPRHNLALTYTERGDFRRAEKEYTKAIEFTPYHPYLQYNLGYLLQNENRLREAERQYKSAVNAMQTIIGKHVAARDLALDRGGAGGPYYQERLVLEGKIILALQENLAEAYNALGTVRENLGDSGGAEMYYGKALANADLKEARHNLASLEVAQSRKRGLTDTERTKLLRSAEDLWLLNLSRRPDDRPSLLGLARAYREDKRPAEAIPRYLDVLRLDAGHIAAREELAQALAEAGQNDDAVRAFEDAIQREQVGRSSGLANPALYEAFGDLYWRLQRSGDACKHYNAAAQGRKMGLTAPGDLKMKLKRCAAK